MRWTPPAAAPPTQPDTTLAAAGRVGHRSAVRQPTPAAPTPQRLALPICRQTRSAAHCPITAVFNAWGNFYAVAVSERSRPRLSICRSASNRRMAAGNGRLASGADTNDRRRHPGPDRRPAQCDAGDVDAWLFSRKQVETGGTSMTRSSLVRRRRQLHGLRHPGDPQAQTRRPGGRRMGSRWG